MSMQRWFASLTICVASVAIFWGASPIYAQHGGHGHGGGGVGAGGRGGMGGGGHGGGGHGGGHSGHGGFSSGHSGHSGNHFHSGGIGGVPGNWSRNYSHSYHSGNHFHGSYGGYRGYGNSLYSSRGSGIYINPFGLNYGYYGLGNSGLSLGLSIGGLYQPYYGYYGSGLYGSGLYGSGLYGSGMYRSGIYGSGLYGPRFGVYNPGYYSGSLYSNGYYSSPLYGSTTVFDPIISLPNSYPQSGTASLTNNYLRSSRSYFAAGDYANAQRLANHSVVETPGDAKSQELLSLSLFAQGDYHGAAAAARTAAELAPVADWPTLYGYYNDKAKYTAQLESLINFVKENPQAADARFLVASHHLMMGHKEQAKQQFGEYLKLKPGDPVAEKLYKELGGNPESGPKPTLLPPPAAPIEAKPPGPSPTPST